MELAGPERLPQCLACTALVCGDNSSAVNCGNKNNSIANEDNFPTKDGVLYMEVANLNNSIVNENSLSTKDKSAGVLYMEVAIFKVTEHNIIVNNDTLSTRINWLGCFI